MMVFCSRSTTTYFPRVITSAEPPLVFCRPDTGGIAGLASMQVIGSAGNWTGFYVRAYDDNTNQPNGRCLPGRSRTGTICAMKLRQRAARVIFTVCRLTFQKTNTC
ncbi:hypothetical protein EMIT0P43_10274 [Pseudomonas jessenii]